jgi:hypothetical protein
MKGDRLWTFSNWTRLDPSLYVSWFASELCLSVTMMCCSAGFMTSMRIKQRINLKFLVKLEKINSNRVFPTVKGGVQWSCYLTHTSFWMAQMVHGRMGGSGRWWTSGTPFNINNRIKCWENQWNCWPEGQTVNQKYTYYLDILTKLRECVRKKRPKLCKKKSWILHQDNEPAHNALAVKQFLADKCIPVLTPPPPP